MSFSVRGRLFGIDMGLDANVGENAEGYDEWPLPEFPLVRSSMYMGGGALGAYRGASILKRFCFSFLLLLASFLFQPSNTATGCYFTVTNDSIATTEDQLSGQLYCIRQPRG